MNIPKYDNNSPFLNFYFDNSIGFGHFIDAIYVGILQLQAAYLPLAVKANDECFVRLFFHNLFKATYNLDIVIEGDYKPASIEEISRNSIDMQISEARSIAGGLAQGVGEEGKYHFVENISLMKLFARMMFGFKIKFMINENNNWAEDWLKLC